MFVVIAYDIADDKRRLRTMKLLEGYGAHVQESVFEFDLEPREMVQRLTRLVSLQQDNVRFYHLCSKDVKRIEQLGVGRSVQLAREFQIV